jgi:glycosyltransferase involved in cell wall biosynthesis
MSKGAAPGLALDLALVAKSQGRNINLIIKSDNELMERLTLELQPNEITILNFKKSILFALMNLIRNGELIFSKIDKKLIPNEPMVIPMPGIFEYKIPKRIKEKYSIFIFIHDPARHRGDFLPRNFMIKNLYLKSQHVIYFSNYTRMELNKRYGNRNKPSFVLSHPIPSLVERITNVRESEKKYLLLIGRNKKYQNFQRIVDFWIKNEVEFPDLSLLIAGKNVSRYANLDRRIFTEDRWLSEIEFGELMLGAEVVVLPYLEASQSGPASLAIGMGKKTIYSRIGGLPEQLFGYKNGLSFSSDLELLNTLRIFGAAPKSEKIEIRDWKDGWLPFLGFLESGYQGNV